MEPNKGEIQAKTKAFSRTPTGLRRTLCSYVVA